MRYDADQLARDLLPAVLAAGRSEMRHFRSGLPVEAKPDRSPVTLADREAEEIVVGALSRIAPDIPVVAEEAAAAGRTPQAGRRFFLVDALDGTHLFIRGKPEFSVNIALVEDEAPLFGLIYVPPTGQLYVTRSDGASHRAMIFPDAAAPDFSALGFTPLVTRPPDPENLVAFNSRTAGGACAEFLTRLNVREARPIGSSQKFCLIAGGDGDLYARFGTTYEWDTAAGQAILEAAGGSVTTLDGRRLSYGKSEKSYLNPHFVAWGKTPLVANFTPGRAA